MARKMKDETAGVPNKEFFRFKPKIRSFFVVDSSEYKKAKSVNKNVVATINQNEYKDVLLNNKCFFVKLQKYYFNFLSSQNSFLSSYKKIILISSVLKTLFLFTFLF